MRRDVVMTGETRYAAGATYRRTEAKVLGAHRAGITTVIIPKANEADVEDVPDEVRQLLTFHPVETLSQVLDIALVAPEEPAQPLEAVA